MTDMNYEHVFALLDDVPSSPHEEAQLPDQLLLEM